MKYKDIYAQAKKNDDVQPISSIFKKDWKKGETIIGKLMSVTEITSDRFKSTYFSYLLNTDEGNIKTALGAGVDAEVRPFMKVGQIYLIRSEGTKDIGKGSEMKIFTVEHIVTEETDRADEAVSNGAQEEIPF